MLWSGLSAFCVLLGIFASVVVLRKLCQRHRQNISTNDFFVFNLTIIDLVFLICLPFSVYNYMLLHNSEFEFFNNFTYSLPICGRPLFMACVCGDYYFAVVHPIIYINSRRTAIIRKVIAVTIWLFIICFGLLLVIYPWIFTTTFTSTPLFISLPVIGFCDVSVLQALRKPDPSGKSNIHPQKKRALRTIINSFILTFTAYLPPVLIFSFGHNLPIRFDMYYCILIFIAICSTVSGGVIMPFLYLESIGQLNIQHIVAKIKMRR
ncbi:lysophosphatidic acid receptor 4-like [Chanodichthys erythropterus]|uniref:lysophosphatidic acid receptor 4-like n=1 Tax=Chanodichthys erythropterus TaxID=933992 RepID=UPI00351DC8A0